MELLDRTTKKLHASVRYIMQQWVDEHSYDLTTGPSRMGTGEVSCTGIVAMCPVQGKLEVGDNSVVYNCTVAEGTHVKIGADCHVRNCKFYGDVTIGDGCVIAGVSVWCTANIIIGDNVTMLVCEISGTGRTGTATNVYIGDSNVICATLIKVHGGLSIGSDGFLSSIGIDARAKKGVVFGKRLFIARSGALMYDLETAVNSFAEAPVLEHAGYYTTASSTISSKTGAVRVGDDFKLTSRSSYIRAYGNVMIGDRVRISDSESANGYNTVLAYKSIRVGSDANIIRDGCSERLHNYRPNELSPVLNMGSRSTLVYGIDDTSYEGLEIKEGDVVAV